MKALGRKPTVEQRRDVDERFANRPTTKLATRSIGRRATIRRMATAPTAMQSNERQPTSSDTACSTACVRAGITALIFAGLAWTLLVPLSKRPALESLGSYLTLRLRLSDAVGQVAEDRCWQHAKSVAGDSIEDAWSLTKVASFRCGLDVASIREFAAPPPNPDILTLPAARQSGIDLHSLESTAISPPAAPRGLTFGDSWFHPGVEILRVLRELTDPKLLALASEASNRFNFSIHRWTIARWTLATSRTSAPRENVSYPYVTQIFVENSSSQSRADLEKDLDWLTLSDAKKLADTESIDVGEFDKVAAEQNEVHLPILQGTIGIQRASLIVECVILVSLLWFWLNLKELSWNSARPLSTILSLFQQGRLTRLLFCAALLLVVIPAALLAVGSYTLQPANAGILALSVLTARAIITETGWSLHHLTKATDFRPA